MLAVRRFFSGQTKEERKIGYSAFGELLFVEREEIREVAGRRYVLQAKFGNCLRQSAREARGLSDGREIGQVVGACGSVDDASGQRFDAEAGDGRQREAAHGLSGKVRGNLRERESVNALAAGRKSSDGELRGGGSRRRDDQDLAVRLFRGQERGGAIEQRGIGAGVNERARGHR